jgi:FtsP/CotA-like multicopper oxidase with cupredoxin domain
MDLQRVHDEPLPGRHIQLRARVLIMWVAVALTGASTGLAGQAVARDATPERIAINDNKVAAGTQADGTLTVRLEARAGEWRPDGDTDPGVNVLAFAVQGGPLQIPGPLIRVTEGTEVRAFVRNRLEKEPLILHGMSPRTTAAANATDAITIASGEERELRFVAGAPGTYYYWAATSDILLAARLGRDSQLSGAFIVEPRGGASKSERVFVIGHWTDSDTPIIQPGSLGHTRIVMNGKSWPHTERLAYRVGDNVHIRVINAGASVHPMHLHGFYFNVDSRGDERSDVIFPSDGSPHLVNTERLAPGRTFSLTWVPTRPGNWLFHCHDTAHISRSRPLDGQPPATAADHHVTNHALEMMSGPVIGINVSATATTSGTPEAVARRTLRLVAQVERGGTADEPAFGFTLEDGKTTKPDAPPYLPGPTIVLKRGEPVSITVVNQLPEATAIHWHGIELESYYDGVAGFAGDATRLAPAIAPGTSFEALFTPPRAGTFIYHTHVDEIRQEQAGLTGALLVVETPAAYDPQHDIVLLVTVPRRTVDAGVVLLNGSSSPAALDMRVGERYRLRFINVHTFRPSMRMRVMRGNAPLTWRAVAKDGMDLPADQALVGPSAIQMGNGETYDFEFSPDAAGDLRVEVTTGTGDLLVSMPVHVR